MANTKREMIHDTIDENLSKEGKNIVKIKNFQKIFKISKIKYIISCCKNKGNEAIKNLSFCIEEGLLYKGERDRMFITKMGFKHYGALFSLFYASHTASVVYK